MNNIDEIKLISKINEEIVTKTAYIENLIDENSVLEQQELELSNIVFALRKEERQKYDMKTAIQSKDDAKRKGMDKYKIA